MKNYLSIIIIGLLLVLSDQVSAQQTFRLSGMVIDSTDGNPMPGATIMLSYKSLIVATDRKGQFEFNVPVGDFAIITKFVGYRASRGFINFKGDTTITIVLDKISNELSEVIVAAKASQNLKRPILGVSSLNIKTLRKIPTAMGEVDILRGLQMLPGVSSVGEASNGVNIRGGTTDQNLMLLDDAPIFNPTHMFGLFSAFPSEAVSGVDLYKGNVPARYGGRASAVMDVQLAQPSLEQFSMEGGVSFVSNRVKMDIPLITDKMGIMISGRGAFNDWALPLVSKQLKDLKANFGDASAKLFYKMNSKNTLSLSSYYSYDFFRTESLGSIGEINSTSTDFRYSTLNFSGKWFTAINNNLNLQTTLVSSQYQPSILLPELNSGKTPEIRQDIDFKRIATNLNYYFGKHKIEGVLDATYYELNPGELLPNGSTAVRNIATPIEKGLELAIGIEDEVEISDALTISAGMRYSNYRSLGPGLVNVYRENSELSSFNLIDSVFVGKGETMASYGGLEPRVGIRYALNKRNSLKFGFNIMRQYLQVISNTTTPIPTSRWKSSDTHIKPQVSNLYTLGYFKDTKTGIYEYSIEGYFRYTQNVIDYKPGADFLLQAYPETELLQGVNKSYGIETMVSKKKGEVTGWINYTWARSFNKINSGEGFSQSVNFGNWYAANYDRPHTFNASMIINQGKHHDFGFNFTYSTGRPYTTPVGFVKFSDASFPFYTVRNNSRIPDYHRLDFSWNIYQPSMKDKKWKGNWTFTVYNLYGRKNAYSIFMRTEGLVAKPYKLTVFGAPIVSLAYNFKFL
ncbi:TonB-dependent Receptor Plug Domain [Spirosomataceae bacterium TFI 002]|nr:TonB-dependent Receptor Plug Domain [Spirosomataceae bacterium TFI 002]